VKTALLFVMSFFYVAAGVLHFAKPKFFLSMMPPYLPWHGALVAISGVAEIGLGLALLPASTRVYAAWGIIALLIAVFPANVYAATAGIPGKGGYGRLPFQAVLIAWAWWYTRGASPDVPLR
jgi:uncharacterized membrane protein